MEQQRELFATALIPKALRDGAARTSGGGRVPLAARMRPRKLDEVRGQDHLLANDSLLRRLIRSNSLGSILLYGPPGCGKTSLAEAVAGETNSRFIRLNAVLSNVAELRDILSWARQQEAPAPVLFIDELHRFNKAQQDLLLPDVEEGSIRLIGATTHNPGFYVIPPLLSRSHLFRLDPLPQQEVAGLLQSALEEERGLGSRRHQADEKVLLSLARLCDGDARRALNALEVIALGQNPGTPIEPESLETFARERRIRYDANEDEHYDTISAFIKSIRGGDPDAALYWLAKMLAGGEDPRFIARRLVILASEDIGMADSRALPLAVAAFQACDFVGLPECELHLAHASVYLATAPKSNSAYLALSAAKAEIRQSPVQPVPIHLRDSGGSASKRAGHGQGYLYSHDFPEAISGQAYMESHVQFYRPKKTGEETAIAARLARWKSRRESGLGGSGKALPADDDLDGR